MSQGGDDHGRCRRVSVWRFPPKIRVGVSPRGTVRVYKVSMVLLTGGATEWCPYGSRFAVNVVRSLISMYIGIVHREEEHT